MSLIKRGVGGKILRGPGGSISRCCCGTALTCDLCPDWSSSIDVTLFAPVSVSSGCIDGAFEREIFSGTLTVSLTDNEAIRTLIGASSGDCVWANLSGRKLFVLHKTASYASFGYYIVVSGSAIASSFFAADGTCSSFSDIIPSSGRTSTAQNVIVSYDGGVPSSNIKWTFLHPNNVGLMTLNHADTTDPVSGWTLTGSTAFLRTYQAVTSGSIDIPPDIPVDPWMTWQSDWDCDCMEWGEPYGIQSSFSGTESGWQSGANGVATITLNSFGVPELCDIADAICYYVWTTYYDCQTQTWSEVTLLERNLTGPESDWQNMGGMWQKVTTTNTAPAAPSTPPVCYCDWICDYDCNTLTWGMPYMTYCYEGWGEMPWQIYGTQAYGTFTAGTTPDSPTEPGQC